MRAQLGKGRDRVSVEMAGVGTHHTFTSLQVGLRGLSFAIFRRPNAGFGARPWLA
jgi:hypothetical protein